MLPSIKPPTTSLTGTHVRTIRGALGLTIAQLANVLGVHPSSVQRWELAGGQPIKVEGVPLTVLNALRIRVLHEAKGRQLAAATGQQVSTKLATGGVLLALAVLLLFAAGEEK